MVVYSGFWFALVRRLFLSWSVPSCSDLSSFLSRLTKLGLIVEATICFSANLAMRVGLFVVIHFFRISFIFRKCSRTLIRAVLRVPLLYCATERRSLHAALSFFLSVSFRSLRFGVSNVFIFLRDCFIWLVWTLGFGCFLRRVFFFSCASFTYLELFYLRYFSYAAFLSACLHLLYRNVFRHMRFSQSIHLMLQLVEGFSFSSIFIRPTVVSSD